MKKLILAGLCLLAFTLRVEALGVADIPAISIGAGNLVNHAIELQRFAQRLNDLSDNNFQITVIDSTQTVTLTASQRQGLIAKYQDIRAQIVADVQALPQ